MDAMTASQRRGRARSPTREILDAYRFLAAHEGVFCEPASAAGVAGLLAHGAERRRAGRLRAHRPRAEGPADRARPRRRGRAVRAGPRRGRAGRARVMTRRRRRPRPGVLGQPRARASTSSPRALGLHMEVEVVETGHFARRTPTCAIAARPRATSSCAAFARAAPGRRLRVPDPLRHPARPAASARAPRRSSPGWSPPTRSSSSTPTCSATRRGSRAIPDNVAAALLGGFVLCADGARRALRRRRPGSRRCSSSRTSRCAPPRRAPRSRPRCRWPTPSSTSPTPSLLVLGLARGDWDLVARGLADRLHQPRRAHLYPRSLELVAARARARRARRDDLRRRPDRARLVRTTRRPARWSSGSPPRRGLGRGPPRAVRAARRRRRALRSASGAGASGRVEQRRRRLPPPAVSGPCRRNAPRRRARGSRGRGPAGSRGSSGPCSADSA